MKTSEKTGATPGPWRVNGRHVFAGEGHQVVAEIYSTNGDVRGAIYANAHLIAAAPAMRDALVAVQRAVVAEDALTRDEAALVNAALAQARGEAR